MQHLHGVGAFSSPAKVQDTLSCSHRTVTQYRQMNACHQKIKSNFRGGAPVLTSGSDQGQPVPD